MAIATPTGLGSVTTANGGSVNNLTVNKPSATSDGDVLMIAALFRNAGGTISPAAGWTLIGTQNTTNEAVGIYFKAIPSAAGETATSYNFTTSGGSSRAAMICFRVTGANLSAVADAAGTWSAYAQYSTNVLPSVSAVGGYTMLIAMAMTNNASTGAPSLHTAPAGMTTVGQATADNGTSATAVLWVGSEIRNTAGATGTRTVTISPAALNVTGLMVTITGIPDVAASASVYPDAVLAATGWTASSGTITTAVADENDASYAESATLTGSDTTLSLSMQPLTAATRGVLLEVRAALDVSATTVTKVRLLQGATLIKEWTIAPDSLTTYSLTATASEVSAITDWSNLTVNVLSHI